MTKLRRHLREWATVSLVVQVGWVWALVPRDCCATHQPARAEAKHDCRESKPTAHCPMRSSDGMPCPMHRGQPEERDRSSSGTETTECGLRGTCDGPMTALLTLLSNHGVLSERATAKSIIDESDGFTPAGEKFAGRLESPDPPPPRA